MKINHYTLTILTVLLMLTTGCKKNNENTDIPKVTTANITDIGDVYATGGGTVISAGTSKIFTKGVCWSTKPSPTNQDNIAGLGKDSSVEYSVGIAGLKANTTYYARAYAMNNSGVGYGNEVSFTTISPCPIISTTPVTDVTLSTFTTGGSIASGNGSDIIAKGVCWDTKPNPGIAGNKTSEGSGTGIFASYITGLAPNTKYYVRAYATSKVGTGYGKTLLICTNVIDIDNNVYKTVTIGNQIWLAENLKVTHYRNGEAILEVRDNTAWQNLTSAAYCNYNNDTTLTKTYGRLYNWYAATDSRNIAPSGWHVTSKADLQSLLTYIGPDSVGAKLREKGTAHWTAPNTGATNSSGFTGLPGGGRGSYFEYLHNFGHWWTSTVSPNDIQIAFYWGIYSNDDNNYQFDTGGKSYGMSVRCIHD